MTNTNDIGDPGLGTVAELSANDPDVVDPYEPLLDLGVERTWLALNRRLLEEADDPSTPLGQRIEALAIVDDNLDIFFRTHIGELKEQVAAGIHVPTADQRSPLRQLEDCRSAVHAILGEQRRIYAVLMSDLAHRDIRIVQHDRLPTHSRDWLREHFRSEIFPILTPLAMDPAGPFPYIANLTLNLLIDVRFPEASEVYPARVRIPVSKGVSRRLVSIDGANIFVPLEDVIAANLDMLFPRMEILSWAVFRLTRHGIFLPDSASPPDLEKVEPEPVQEHLEPVVRLEVQSRMKPVHRGMLAAELGLDEMEDVFEVEGLMAMRDLFELAAIVTLDERHGKTPSIIRNDHSPDETN
jgi:polyphosphate kinase